jgi:hypothetical protein
MHYCDIEGVHYLVDPNRVGKIERTLGKNVTTE